MTPLFLQSCFALFLSISVARGQNQDFQVVKQIVDHNERQTSGTWSQRYWSSDSSARQGGPLFVMLVGETEASADYYGFVWTKYAQQYGATTVILEHRYYGPQGYTPTTNSSVSTLQRLFTSEQALADAAEFINWYKSVSGLEDAQVVVFGGSYAGNLAAWFREKYPTVANVAVASSAPLEATTVFYQGMAYVDRAIRESNADCYTAIVNAIHCAKNIINGDNGCSQSVTESSQLPNAFGINQQYDFNDTIQKDQFFSDIMFDYYQNEPASDAQCPCQILVNEAQENTNDPLAAYSAYMQKKQSGCSGSEQATLQHRIRIGQNMRGLGKHSNYQSVGATDYDGDPWDFQLCNEFSYQFTGAPSESVFGYEFSTIDFPNGGCPWLGSTWTPEQVQENVDKTNSYYEGQEYDGTCTIFVTGTWDPWSSLSLNATNSDNLSLIDIPHMEHCGDMYQGQELTSYQQKIQALIGQYLQNPACGSGGNSTGTGLQ